ncbi:hypothetical protein KM540_gp109 [Western grey kangaroopox virus]|uniref:Uncharacterized protein n=1 Tax=Western grey kangaroopox virus TaxID=1566307 RepID=A0A2C9DSQ7_9POXV|nr:hypothetical protein KM540_gp109 [Western grey kangaroopox virus]ATI21040.1 hypothetical protein [Western grey kangaroopox virus]
MAKKFHSEYLQKLKSGREGQVPTSWLFSRLPSAPPAEPEEVGGERESRFQKLLVPTAPIPAEPPCPVPACTPVPASPAPAAPAPACPVPSAYMEAARRRESLLDQMTEDDESTCTSTLPSPDLEGSRRRKKDRVERDIFYRMLGMLRKELESAYVLVPRRDPEPEGASAAPAWPLSRTWPRAESPVALDDAVPEDDQERRYRSKIDHELVRRLCATKSPRDETKPSWYEEVISEEKRSAEAAEAAAQAEEKSGDEEDDE